MDQVDGQTVLLDNLEVLFDPSLRLLDDPEAFYAPLSDDWAQGDLVLACRLGPAIVVTDDCEIDKEFNARVSELVSQGKPESAAITEARADRSLDPFVVVAPIQPFTSLRYVSRRSVRTARAPGYFPIVGGRYMDEGFVDLGVVTSISRQLLRQPIATLSEGARSLLRWKIAQTYAARNCSVDAQIAAAVGRTITGVRTLEDNKHHLVVHLELDGGNGSLTLRQEPRRQEMQSARTRGRTES